MAASKSKARKWSNRDHPGVVLIHEPDRGRWRARYVDPDTYQRDPATGGLDLKRGKFKKETLPVHEARTVKGRRDWAIRKRRALDKRIHDLEKGAVRKTGTGLEAAIARYYDDHPRLREGTQGVYKVATNRFLVWAESERLKTCDQLTRGKVVAYRAWLQKQPKTYREGERGQRAESEETLSGHSVNRELRTLHTVLTYLRRLDLLPFIQAQHLKDGLTHVKVGSEQVEHLTAVEIRALLQAAIKHDAKTVLTREEEAALRSLARAEGITRREMAQRQPEGTTPAYEPIAPFIAVALLTGVRFGEALNLPWLAVDLDAFPAGGIHLKGATTKTGKHRDIDLAVSPALRELLAAMKENADTTGRVFPASKGTLQAAAKRLKGKPYHAPAFTWQTLRRTCGTFLTNAPGIFGAASAYRSARQLGHSVTVAEDHYLGVVRGIPATAKTLESAMGIETEIQAVIDGVR